MSGVRCAGNEQNVRTARQQPREAKLRRGGAHRRRNLDHPWMISDLRPSREMRPAQWEERHPCDAVRETQVEHVLILPAQQAMPALDADNPGRNGSFEIRAVGGTDADRPNFAFISQGDQHGQLIVDVDDLIALRHQSWRDIQAAQIDDRKLFQSKAAQIVVDTGAKLLGALCGFDGKFLAWIRVSTDFGNDDEFAPIEQDLADDIVDKAIRIKLGRIDVIDAQIDCPPQKRRRVCRLVSHALDLHRAKTDSSDSLPAEGEGVELAALYRLTVGHQRKSMIHRLVSGGSSVCYFHNRRALRLSTPQRPRSDGIKNRDRIVAEAQRLFATADAKVSLEAIARAAEVGIGTLYRHFPTKEALVEAVYRSELDALDSEADDLLSKRPPAEAMRQWMDSYTKFVVAKHAMHDALRIALAPRSTEGSEIRTRINATIAKFLTAGSNNGSIRSDFQPDDVTVILAGSVLPAALSADRRQISRVLDLLMGGLRPTKHEAGH